MTRGKRINAKRSIAKNYIWQFFELRWQFALDLLFEYIVGAHILTVIKQSLLHEKASPKQIASHVSPQLSIPRLQKWHLYLVIVSFTEAVRKSPQE